MLNLKAENPVAITLTDNAEKHFEKISKKNSSALGIRLGVKKAGCSGLSYIINVAENITDTDIVQLFNKVKIIIDKDHLPFLNGMTVDYHTEGLNSQIKFINPNVKSSCGCGESFSIDK